MDTLGAGGAERSNTDFWMYARQHGVQVTVIVFGHRTHGTEKEVLEAGLNVIFLKQRHPIINAWELSKIIRREGPDIVHSTLFKSNLRTRLTKLFGVSFLHVESLVNTTYDKKRLNDPNVVRYKMEGYRIMDALTINPFADHLHAITHEVKHHYVKKLAVRPAKVRVIPRGRNPNPYRGKPNLRSEFRQEFGVPENTTLLVSVGRQEYQKGHIYMIDALRYLRDNLKATNFMWLLLGRKGHATAAIEEKIEQYGLAEHIVLGGHRYDVEKILPTTDIFVFPSLYEGLGVSLIEAQAAGLPIICSDLPVFHETTSCANALYVEPLECRSLAKAMNTLLAQPELRTAMGEASLKNFHARFHLDKIHDEMVDYFTRLVDHSACSQR